MSTNYLRELDTIFSYLNGENVTGNTTLCYTKINHYHFYQYILIPAFLLTIIFAMFEKRKSFLPHLFGGRPGCVYPMDALSRTTRMSYACAFGATVFVLFGIIFEQKFAFEYTGPLYLKTIMSIVSVIIYGMAFYPIFASITQGTVFSYGLGSLYVWVFTCVQFYKSFECDSYLTVRILSVARDLPNLLCWVYLSISLPYRFIMKLKERSYFQTKPGELDRQQTLDDIMDSYQGHAVRRLLVRPEHVPEPQGIKGKLSRILCNIVHEWLYHWKKDFQYSSRVLSVMIVGIQIIYIATYELISSLYPLCLLYMGIIWEGVLAIGATPVLGELAETTGLRNYLLLLFYIVYAVSICLIVSAVTAFVLGLVLILHMLSSYRRNLQALYRGDFSHIPPIESRSNASHMVGFLRYAGYQVGYIGWSYIIQFLVLFLVTFGLATVITLIQYGYYDWLLNYVLQLWPVLLIAIVLNVFQILVAKFFFLEGDKLVMNNRRALFVFTYFMFFFNVFLGFVSCIMRILKSIVIGTLFLGRLDHSTLSRRFQFMDPGFAAYVGFLHVENAHTHPVVVVFVRLMLMNLQTKQHTLEANRGDIKMAEEETLSRRKHSGARFNWYVMYTLLNNPSLRMYRKGYMQGIQKTMREGKRHIISDNMLESIHAHDSNKRQMEMVGLGDSKNDSPIRTNGWVNSENNELPINVNVRL